MKTQPFKVVICDGDLLYRTKLNTVLAEMEGIQVVAETGSDIELFSALMCTRPDLILLDLQMLAMNGHRILPKIKDSNPFIDVIALTLYDECDTIDWLKEVGVESYLNKYADTEVFYETILSVLEKKYNLKALPLSNLQ